MKKTLSITLGPIPVTLDFPLTPSDHGIPAFVFDADALDLPDATRINPWRDLSGNGNDLSDGDPAHDPYLVRNAINGFNVVRGDGNTQLLRCPITLSAPLTVFIVARQPSAPQYTDLIRGTDTTFGWDNETLGLLSGSGALLSGPAVRDTAPHVYAFRVADGKASIWQDGNLIAAGPSSFSIAEPMTLWGHNGQYPIDYAMALGWKTSLRDTSIAAITQEMRDKYGI